MAVVPVRAILGAAFKDVFGGRLGWLAAFCLFVALGVTIAAAWAGFRYLVPMIDDRDLSFALFGYVIDMATPLTWLASAGVIILAIVLAPAVSMIVGGALFDVAAARVEKAIGAPAGRMVTWGEGLANGLRIGLPALAFNILTIPLLFVPILNLIVFFWLNGYLMGREYSTLAAVRRMSWRDARAFRRRYAASVFLIGLVCSFIPFVAPLLGASAMTRLVANVSSRPPPTSPRRP